MLFSIIGVVCGLGLIFLSISLYFYLKFNTQSIQANPSITRQEENNLLNSNGTPSDQEKNLGQVNQHQSNEKQTNGQPQEKRQSSQNRESNDHCCGLQILQPNSQNNQNEIADSKQEQNSNNQGETHNSNQIEQVQSEKQKGEIINQQKNKTCNQNKGSKNFENKSFDKNDQSNKSIKQDLDSDYIKVEEQQDGIPQNSENKQQDSQQNGVQIEDSPDNENFLNVGKEGPQDKSSQLKKELNNNGNPIKSKENIIILDASVKIEGENSQHQTNEKQINDCSQNQECNQIAQQSNFEEKEKQQDLQKLKDQGEKKQEQRSCQIDQHSQKMEIKEDNSSTEKPTDNQQTPLQTALASVQQNQNQLTIQTILSNKESFQNYDKKSKSPQQQKLIKNYECIQIIYLLISCSIFVQAVKTRIFLKQKPEKRNYPYFCEQGVYSALISLAIVNLLYCVPFEKILKSTSPQFRILSRFSLILYGFTMVFPIYAGLDEFLDLEIISIFFSFTFSLIIQLVLEKCFSKCYKFPLTKLISTKISTFEQIQCE